MGIEETTLLRLQQAAEICTNKSTAETASDEDIRWTCSIRMNNLGLDHLMHGRLLDARSAFFEADNLYRQAPHVLTYDADAREYQSNWINVESIVDSIATSDEMTSTMCHIFLFGLRIGHAIDDMDDSSDENIDVLCTTRIDWAISYNLGLVTQLLGITTTDIWGMTYRADSFDRYEQLMLDVVAWYDGLAPLDAAILMMALHNNQGSIYLQLKVDYQVTAHWGRMRSILNASRPLQEHSICKTFLQNLAILMKGQESAAAA
jgi:hypothetical protein